MATEAEKKIIDATVECIEKYGIQGTTIRKIGDLANMNSASINYYFRSKEILIQKVLEITLDNAFRWADFEYTEPMNYEDQLNEIVLFFISGAFRFPRITQAHFNDIIVNGNYDIITTKMMNAFLEKLYFEGMRKHPEFIPDQLRMALVNLISSTMLYFSFFGKLFNQFTQKEMCDEENYKKYVNQIVKSMLCDLKAM